jgi:hypothetical protein
MKVIYLFVFITFIVILLLGRSIFSYASALANSVTSSSNSSQGQTGGKKAKTFLMTILFVMISLVSILYIMSKLNK